MELILYYREQCHLCDAMRKALVAFSRKRQPISWREVDIDRDTDLIRLYDARVPVLCDGDTEICHFFFDESALLAALALA
ncbi:MAG: glutaredoxin family protein [Gammaproteobacteria bacterium]|nr:glutaredoxin family protein [Gammaproteobacteria bacterium]MDH3536739.1 glutaredoxin family protein [Gammaproteobacteria bacterium]